MPLSRRGFVKAVSSSAAAVTLARAQAAPQPRAGHGRRPSFVFILCDDLGYGDLACFGHPAIRTPNLDRLAGEGMRLTSCYAAAPVCSPSRAGAMTGRTPMRCRIPDWIPWDSDVHLKTAEISVARLLKGVGYATAHVGKWHLNGKFNRPEQPMPDAHGFDHYFATQNNAHPSHRNPDNFVRNGEPVGPLEGYSSTLIVDEAIRFVQEETNRPFMLFVWLHATHEPIATADEFVRMYAHEADPERATYMGNVTQMDFEVGRLLHVLDEMGRRDDTMVMFTSDNGPETLKRYRGAERSHGSPGPLRGMKLHLYEGGIRVPGIIRYPGSVNPEQVCDEPVINTDILPTYCALAGAKVPADRAIDGASLVPVFRGRPVKRTLPLYWRYDKAFGGPKVAMRQGDWKVLARGDLTGVELYNLAEDIGETTDLAQKAPKRLKAMTETLREIHEDVDKDPVSL